jgi:hypothetical protein
MRCLTLDNSRPVDGILAMAPKPVGACSANGGTWTIVDMKAAFTRCQLKQFGKIGSRVDRMLVTCLTKSHLTHL